MGDPTLEELARLTDPAHYAPPKVGVPIWVPHRRPVKSPDGTAGEVVVREADLQAYADFINGLESEKGVPGRVTDGHVKPGEPMPRHLGYYRNARVGRFGPRGTPAVLVDLYIRREAVPVAQDRPYRSVEVYPAAKQIRGLALLLRDPALDMGVVTYDARSRDRAYLYAMGESMGPTDANLGGQDKGGAGETKPDAPDHSPEEKALFEKMRTYLCSTYGLDEGWPRAKADAEQKPGGEEGKPAPDDKPKEEVTPMQLNQLPEQYQREMAELRGELRGLQLERDQERCQMLLYGLETEGFQLSQPEKAKELAKLAKLPAADRPDRIGELKAIYAERKVPQGRLEMYGGHVETGGKDESDPFAKPWYQDDAEAYMMSHPGMEYAKAVEYVKGQHAKK